MLACDWPNHELPCRKASVSTWSPGDQDGPLLRRNGVRTAASEPATFFLDEFLELAAIRSQLGEIQGSLTTLQTAVAQLRSEVAQSEYSVLVGQTSPITSEINTAMVDLDDLGQTAGVVGMVVREDHVRHVAHEVHPSVSE